MRVSNNKVLLLLLVLASVGLLAHHFLNQKITSKAEVIGSKCFTKKHNDRALLSIHLVTVPFLNYKAPREKLQERMLEYKHVLQLNLAHPLVQCVHLLTENFTETLEVFREVSNKSRMLISELNDTDLARRPWEYISSNLVGEDVMFINADIYLGNGFELVKPATMDEKKIMYALTRMYAPQDRCRDENGDLLPLQFYCPGHENSQDSFLFRLHKPLTDRFYFSLNFDLVSLGMEYVVMEFFSDKLGYCVLNPCTILETFHYHCSNLRNKENKPRVSSYKYVLGHSTTKLDC